ncbi:MAG: hypothetical protein J0G30_08510 [Actinomycetales bacterium]|nr:hypothetical protein [Actinomycetales bacterium]
MTEQPTTPDLEARLADWRAALTRDGSVDAEDAEELETHLRDSVAALAQAGLDDDEAFLIAVKRLGAVDAVTREYARVHSGRMWKQLVLGESPASGPVRDRSGARGMLVAAIGAAVLIQVLRLAIAGPDLSDADRVAWFARVAPIALVAPVAGYLVWRMRRTAIVAIAAAAILLLGALAILLPPFTLSGMTFPVALVHLPIVLWLAVAAAYLGANWRSPDRRMDLVRFTGEYAIYLVLIVIGGQILVGLTSFVILPIAPGAIEPLMLWMAPSGGAAALVVATWLVLAKQSVVENLAPVLTAIFTPLFAVMLAVSAVLYAIFGIGRDFDRELLIGFDAVLLVVLALLLYGLSARDAARATRLMDVLRLVAVGAALLLDGLVLGSMLARVGEYGFTPNRVAALGINVLLFANLAVAGVLGVRALLGRGSSDAPERWQMRYLSVFAAWALLMLLVLPPVFGYA